MDGSGANAFASVTCNPFHLESDVGGATLLVDDPNPTVHGSGCCVVTPTVTGCNGLALPGATYSIWSDSTKTNLLFTGTTNSSGQVGPWDLVNCGTYYREISKSRFTTLAGTKSYSSGTVTEAMSGQVASGYHCLAGCADPVANTLTITFSIAGAQTLTFSGSTWADTFSFGGHSFVVTLATAGTMTITRDGTDCGSITLSSLVCPPSFSESVSIAAGTCATELGSPATLTE